MLDRVKRAIHRRSESHLRNVSQSNSFHTAGAVGNTTNPHGGGSRRGTSSEEPSAVSDSHDKKWSLPDTGKLLPDTTLRRQELDRPNVSTLHAFHDETDAGSSAHVGNPLAGRDSHNNPETKSASKHKRNPSKLHKAPPATVIAARLSNDLSQGRISNEHIPRRSTSKRKTSIGRNSLDSTHVGASGYRHGDDSNRTPQYEPLRGYQHRRAQSVEQDANEPFHLPSQRDDQQLAESTQQEHSRRTTLRQYKHDELGPSIDTKEQQHPVIQYQDQQGQELGPHQEGGFESSEKDQKHINPVSQYQDPYSDPIVQNGNQGIDIRDQHQRDEATEQDQQQSIDRNSKHFRASAQDQGHVAREIGKEQEPGELVDRQTVGDEARQDQQPTSLGEQTQQDNQLAAFDRVEPHIDIDFDHTIHHQPAVTHEHIHPHIHTIYEPQRTRSYHFHEHRYYEQPLIDPDASPTILPVQHFAQDHRTGEIFRIPDALGEELDRKYGRSSSEKGEAHDHAYTILNRGMEKIELDNDVNDDNAAEPYDKGIANSSEPHRPPDDLPKADPRAISTSGSTAPPTPRVETQQQQLLLLHVPITDTPSSSSSPSILLALHPDLNDSSHHPPSSSSSSSSSPPPPSAATTDDAITATMRHLAREDHGRPLWHAKAA